MVTYLHAVHLKLADDLDCDLPRGPLAIPRPIYVAEGSIAHLLEELPPLEAGVGGKLALALILFCDEPRNVLVGDALVLFRLHVYRLGLVGFVVVGGGLGRRGAEDGFCHSRRHGGLPGLLLFWRRAVIFCARRLVRSPGLLAWI
jgi:hypothetical protein